MAQPFKSPNGIFQLRRKVPSALRRVLGHEYKRSLKTRDPSEAKTRFAEEWARSDDAFALARAQAGGLDTLGERGVQQLAARWFRAEAQKRKRRGDFADWQFEAETWGNDWRSERRTHSAGQCPASAGRGGILKSKISLLASLAMLRPRCGRVGVSKATGIRFRR
jgi:hypothetical protein